MTISTSGDNQRQVPFISLATFLLITFGLSWGILGLFILLPEPTVAIFGELTGQHPLFFLEAQVLEPSEGLLQQMDK
jgi:uncharacterized protein